jgi:hypothetical protein
LDLLKFLHTKYGIVTTMHKDAKAAATAMPDFVLREGGAVKWLEAAADGTFLTGWDPTVPADDPSLAEGLDTWQEEVDGFNRMTMLACTIDTALRTMDYKETPIIRKQWNRNVVTYARFYKNFFGKLTPKLAMIISQIPRELFDAERMETTLRAWSIEANEKAHDPQKRSFHYALGRGILDVRQRTVYCYVRMGMAELYRRVVSGVRQCVLLA